MILRWVLRIGVVAAVVLVAGGTRRVSAENGPSANAPQAADTADFLKQTGLEGRIALVQFGVVGCPLSEEGIGRMVALDKDHKIPGLAFARIEGGKETKEAADYFTAKAVTFPVRYDADGALVSAFDGGVWPTYVLVDKFGRVRYRGPWPDETKLTQWVEILNKETADAGSGAPMFGVAALDVPKLLDDTRLPDLEGNVKSLRDREGAKGLLALFVDTQCPFSATAIGEMSSVASVLGKQSINSVLVNIDEAKPAVTEFYAQKKTGMPVMYDTGKGTQTAWAVTAVPTAVLIDSSDAIVYRGRAIWADVGAAAEKALSLPAGTIKFTAKGTGAG